jgi:thymidylate synthase
MLFDSKMNKFIVYLRPQIIQKIRVVQQMMCDHMSNVSILQWRNHLFHPIAQQLFRPLLLDQNISQFNEENSSTWHDWRQVSSEEYEGERQCVFFMQIEKTWK